jgi:hypothetical protein
MPKIEPLKIDLGAEPEPGVITGTGIGHDYTEMVKKINECVEAVNSGVAVVSEDTPQPTGDTAEEKPAKQQTTVGVRAGKGGKKPETQGDDSKPVS